MMGNREAATVLAEKAVAMATPASVATAAMARFLAQPAASPAEWTARAGRLAPNPAQGTIRNTCLAYALLLARQYQAAAPVLEQLYGEGQSAGEGVPVLLAWRRCCALTRFRRAPDWSRFYLSIFPGSFTCAERPRNGWASPRKRATITLFFKNFQAPTRPCEAYIKT